MSAKLSTTLVMVLFGCSYGELSAAEAPKPDPAAHTVIVPYDVKSSHFKARPDRFYLDYADFQRLWALAKENRKPEKPVEDSGKPEASITSALYDAEVMENGLRVKARFSVVTRGTDWANLALPFKSGSGTLAVSSVLLDGHPAALQGGVVHIEKAGAHTIDATLELTLERAWKTVALTLPPASAAALSVSVPSTDGRPLFADGQGGLVGEESREGRRTFTLPLSNPSSAGFTRNPALRLVENAPPAQADTMLTMHVLPRIETFAAQTRFSFPGTERRSLSVEIDPTLRLESAKAIPEGAVTLRKEGNRQFLDVVFVQSVAESAVMNLTAIRVQEDAAAVGRRNSPSVRGVAARESTVLNVQVAEALLLRPESTPDAERVQSTAKPMAGETGVGAWRLKPGTALSYVVTAAEDRSLAKIEMLQQLSAQKTEIIAAIVLNSGRGPLANARLGVPAGFEVQALKGARVQSWHREGDEVLVRFDEQPDREARLVVHLARTLAQAATDWTLEPLKLPQFAKQETIVLIAVNAADDVRLTFDTADRTLREEDPRTVRGVTTVKEPMQVKRALRAEKPDWTAKVALVRQAPRFSVEAVMFAQAGDAGLHLSQQVGVHVEQGAVGSVKLRLPADLPEARVSGPTVRDAPSRVVDGVREYTVGFQTEVLDRADFTLDIDLPLEGEKTLPTLQVEGATRMQRFAIVDNAGAREMKLDQGGADSVAQQTIPWLPSGLTRPQYFRLPDRSAIKLSFTQLESTAGNAAIITLAEITTALRASGERWDTVVYSLANRSLQFLPVRLPDGAELVEVSVGGQAVRADRKEAASDKTKGANSYLVPLIQMSAGELSQEVKLVYRVPARGGAAAKHRLDDPELIGLSAERTLWNVWVPDGHEARGFEGNMDEVGEEGHELEKQRSLLSEVSRLNRVISSGEVYYRDAKMALDNANKALGQLKDIRMRKSRSSSYYESEGKPASKPASKMVEDVKADVEKQILEQGALIDGNSANVAQLEKKERLQSQLGQSQGKLEKPAGSNLWVTNKDLPQKPGKEGGAQVANQPATLFSDNAGVNQEFLTKSGTGNWVFNGGVMKQPGSNLPDLKNAQGALSNARGSKQEAKPQEFDGTVAGVAEREMSRRAGRTVAGTTEMEKGDDLFAAGNFEGALQSYRSALSVVPDSPMTQTLRQTAAAKVNDALVELAREHAKNGRYNEARSLLQEAIAQNKSHAGAQKLLRELDDPDRYEPALTAEHSKNVQDVERQLKQGYSWYNLGDFGKAITSFQEAIRIDPYNQAARLGMERAEMKRSEYFDTARDHLRSKMLNEANRGWEDAAPVAFADAATGTVPLAPAAAPAAFFGAPTLDAPVYSGVIGGSVAGGITALPAAPQTRFVDLNEPVVPLTPQLKPVGRVSLAVDVPLSGTVFHFSKLKDHAALEVTVVKPWETRKKIAFWTLLGSVVLFGAAAWVRRRN